MQNWLKIQNLTPSTLTPHLLDFSQSHLGTYYKIAFADYHYNILNQLYVPNLTERETDTDSWARAEMHSIVNSLYSALDSLAQEINLAYQFGINASNIHIYHEHQHFENRCVRCRLDQVNDSLGTFLNQSLNVRWFDIFRRLYNQIKHKHLPIINVTVHAGGPNVTHIMIPNDPSISNPKYEDYSDELELNQYCLQRRNDVLQLVEKAYTFLEPKARQLFSQSVNTTP